MAQLSSKKGRLIGIGTGPGDPNLVTRKAWQVAKTAKVIAYPAADGKDSFARTIMADAIPHNAIEISINIPMTTKANATQLSLARKAYDEASETILTHLNRGYDVVLLCEGDPLFYGSFIYVMARLKDHAEIEIIPGVTSISAAAAAHHLGIATRSDTLTILPATLNDDTLSRRIDDADSVVIIKLGQHLARIRALLDSKNLLPHAFYVSDASLPQEHAVPLAEAPQEAPYFSIILLRKAGH